MICLVKYLQSRYFNENLTCSSFPLPCYRARWISQTQGEKKVFRTLEITKYESRIRRCSLCSKSPLSKTESSTL